MQRIEINPSQTVLVIGGRGFIGRSIVANLENVGASVLIGSRCMQSPRQLGTRRVLLHELYSDQHCDALLQGVDVVVNAVGILRQRVGETYEQVHHLAVARLAKACASNNIRFVHISALGLSNHVTSRFLSSKLRGERAIKASQADWYICRPSLVNGDGGYGAKWFRRVASWPVHLAPRNAVGRLAPINVEDLGEAVARIALKTDVPSTNSERIFELGGEQTMSVFEYLRVLRGRPSMSQLCIPAWLARLTSHILDLLHLTPFSFGHYELLKFDNCPRGDHASQLLGRKCMPISAANSKNTRALITLQGVSSHER